MKFSITVTAIIHYSSSSAIVWVFSAILSHLNANRRLQSSSSFSSALFSDGLVRSMSSVSILSLTSSVLGNSESTHESSVLFNFSWQIGHFLCVAFHCSMHALQKTCVHGSIRSGLRSKQMQHSVVSRFSLHRACSSIGLNSVTLVSNVDNRRAYRCPKRKIGIILAVQELSRWKWVLFYWLKLSYLIVLFFARWHYLQMRLKCVEHFQELFQIYQFITFNFIRLRIAFDARNSNGRLPQECLVTVLLYGEYCYFAIGVQALAWPIRKQIKKRIRNFVLRNGRKQMQFIQIVQAG